MAEQDFFKRVGTEAIKSPGKRVEESAQGCAPTQPAPPQAGVGSLQATTGEKRWAAIHEVFWGATQTYDILPAGLYRTGISNEVGPILTRMDVVTDSLLVLPDMATDAIVEEFKSFWIVAPLFRQRGFLHKRGFLLWGPPGSGKTTCLQLLIKTLIDDYKGIILFVENAYAGAKCLAMVRQIEPKRPVIVVLEDLDALVEQYGESGYLSLLDGESQVDNVVFLGTTNYPERLDRRFVDRPSRFDTIEYIGMPTADARRVYFKAKEPTVSDAELDAWVAATDGLSIAYLKELIISIRCFGKSLDEVSARLREMHGTKLSSEESPDKTRTGFLRGGLNGRSQLGRIGG